MTRAGVLEQVKEVEASALRAAALVADPELVPASAADALYRAFDQIERSAGTAKLLLAKRVEASGEHSRRGHPTAADYLASVSGSPVGRAKDELATSERLSSCDQTKQALLTGELSPAQGVIVADAASANPGAEEELLRSARKKNHKELKEAALAAKAAADRDREATEARIRKERRLSRSVDGEGAGTFFGRGPITDAVLIEKELDAIVDEGFAHRSDGPLEPRAALLWDALLQMAANSRAFRLGRFADTTAVTNDGGTEEPNRADRRSTRRRPKQPPPKWLALLHVDVAALRRGHLEPGERCHIPGVGPVSTSVAEEILGDAALKLVISDGVDVLNVTSLTRGVTQAMRYAWLWTNPECIVEGCTRTRVEYDHAWGKEYSKTKHTRFVEVTPKCSYHHDLHTRLGWELVVGSGKRPMVPPEHPEHPAHHPAHGAAPPPPVGDEDPSREHPRAGPAPPGPPATLDQPGLFGDAA